MNTIYFAYGSNMDAARMRQRCPAGVELGVAELENHRFIINGRGVATVVSDATKRVYGVL